MNDARVKRVGDMIGELRALDIDNMTMPNRAADMLMELQLQLEYADEKDIERVAQLRKKDTIIRKLRKRNDDRGHELNRLYAEFGRVRTIEHAGIKRIIDAAIDAYSGPCTITDHNLINAVRAYLGGQLP